jgi:hypothetical protein
MRQLPAIDSRSWKQKRGISAPAASQAWSRVYFRRDVHLDAVDENLGHGAQLQWGFDRVEAGVRCGRGAPRPIRIRRDHGGFGMRVAA